MNVDSEEFYNLMQAYRHAPFVDQAAVSKAFEDMKFAIRREMDELEALKKLLPVLPRVHERLQTHSRNSHMGSPSEEVFHEFDPIYQDLKRLMKRHS
jgi:hypothetical protein